MMEWSQPGREKAQKSELRWGTVHREMNWSAGELAVDSFRGKGRAFGMGREEDTRRSVVVVRVVDATDVGAEKTEKTGRVIAVVEDASILETHAELGYAKVEAEAGEVARVEAVIAFGKLRWHQKGGGRYCPTY